MKNRKPNTSSKIPKRATPGVGRAKRRFRDGKTYSPNQMSTLTEKGQTSRTNKNGENT